MRWSVDAATPTVAPFPGGDPYMVWAELTRGAYLASHRQDDVPGQCGVTLALECLDGKTVGTLRGLDPAAIRIPPAYANDAKLCSARIDPLTASLLSALVTHAKVLLAEPGMADPDAPASFALPHKASDPGQPLTARPIEGATVVIGVVDGLCAFAHQRFRRLDGGELKSRIAALWDQGTARADDVAPPEFGYGRELSRSDIERLLNQHLNGVDASDTASQQVAERALYRAAGQPTPEDADWSHGTHVLDLALGSDSLSDKATVVVVQLPARDLRDTSGRWSAARVLDAIHYILARSPATAKVIINLSLGSFAGPHDGSTMLERAIDALIGQRKDRLQVVVAAGNARAPEDDATGKVRRCHGRLALAPKGDPGDSVSLEIEIDRPDATETFIELWLPQNLAVSVQMQPLASMAAGVSLEAGPGKACQLTDDAPADGPRVVAALFNATGAGSPVPNGNGAMVLMAIGGTRDTKGFCAPAGRWKITVTSLGDSPMAVEAWIERRDVPGELAGYRPQFGWEQSGEEDPHTPPDNTLCSLANGAETLVVGAAEMDASAPPNPRRWRPIRRRAWTRPRVRSPTAWRSERQCALAHVMCSTAMPRPPGSGAAPPNRSAAPRWQRPS